MVENLGYSVLCFYRGLVLGYETCLTSCGSSEVEASDRVVFMFIFVSVSPSVSKYSSSLTFYIVFKVNLIPSFSLNIYK